MNKFVKNNTNYRCGDVVFAKCVPFDGSILNKGRPVIYLGREGNMVRYLKCTTKRSATKDQRKICDLISAGLLKTTYVEPEVRYLNFTHLEYRLGRLCREDMEYLGIYKGGI